MNVDGPKAILHVSSHSSDQLEDFPSPYLQITSHCLPGTCRQFHALFIDIILWQKNLNFYKSIEWEVRRMSDIL